MDDDSKSPGSGREQLLYDWFKHLTSLSLLAIGGALSLSQAGKAEVKALPLTIIVVALALAGLCSFTGADKLVRASAAGEPLPRSVLFFSRAAPGFLGVGVGAFLAVFLDSLS